MLLEQFDKQQYYPGLRALVTVPWNNNKEIIIIIHTVDFEEKFILDTYKHLYKLENIIKFLPPSDYDPCKKCGAIHHPKQNTLCER